MSPFTEDLRAWIKYLGLTRSQAAIMLGVPLPTLNGWINGRGCALEGAVRLLMDYVLAEYEGQL